MSNLESIYRTSCEHRIVWECVYAYDHYHRVNDGYGDTIPAGKTRERSTWHVIAPGYELAKAAWLHHHPSHVGYELVSCDPICTINAELRV